MITRLLALSVVLLWGWNLLRAAQQQVGTETACPPQVPNSFCVLYRGDDNILSFTSDIAFSADGQLIATAFGRDPSAKPVIRVWKVSGGQLVYELQGHISDITDVSFSPDGKLLASSSFGYGGVIKLWDVASGREIRTLKPSYGFNGFAIAFSPNGRLLASSACMDSPCMQADIILWDLGSGAEVSRMSMANELGKELADKILKMAFASDELLIAKGLETITIWNVRTRRLVRIILVQGYDMAVSPARQLVAAKSLLDIMIWRIPSGEKFSSISEREFGGVISLSFSPDGRFLAGGEKYFPDVKDRRFMQIWRIGDKIEDWQVARTLAIPLRKDEYGLRSADFSSDGRLLAIRALAYNRSEVIVQLWYVGDLR